MPASRGTMLLMTVVLAVTTSLMAQTPNGGTRRNPPPSEAVTDSAPAPDSATPLPQPQVPSNGAGTVIPPNQGYYVNPGPVPPGTSPSWNIPANPQDRAYWEMYDREKKVTLSGKVTRVDWSMPNSYIYLVAESALWAVESEYIQFLRASVMPAIHVGDQITITGYFPKEEPWGDFPSRISPRLTAYLKTNHLVRAGSITTTFGQRLEMGQPPTEREMADRLKCSPFGC